MAGFLIVGAIKYLNDVVNGDALDPFVTSTAESVNITNLKNYSSGVVDAASKENWTKMQTDIQRLDDSYRGLYGKSVFSDAYQSDLKRYTDWYSTHPSTPSDPNQTALQAAASFITGQNYKPTPTTEELSMFFYSELQDKGQDYIFQRDHKSDFDNRNSILGKELGDINTDFNNIRDAYGVHQLLSQLLPTLIDPGLVQGNYKDIPHNQKFTSQINAFKELEDKGVPATVLNYIKTHPQLLNAGKVVEALKDENQFMDNILKNWDGESIGKSFAEGDFIGGIKHLTTDGVQISENAAKDVIVAAANAANDVLDSDLNPTKGIWDLLKDLFNNAGDYITYALFLGVAIGLLFIIGQIKYVATYSLIS